MFSLWYVTFWGYKGKNPSNTVSALILEILRTKLKYLSRIKNIFEIANILKFHFGRHIVYFLFL